MFIAKVKNAGVIVLLMALLTAAVVPPIRIERLRELRFWLRTSPTKIGFTTNRLCMPSRLPACLFPPSLS